MNASSEVEMQGATAVEETASARSRGKARRRALLLAVPLLLVAGGGYFWLTGGRYETTENANLEQARISISANVSGPVVEVAVHENQHVHEGDLLFRVDPESARIALDQANASLAVARLNVQEQHAALEEARAQLANATDDVSYYRTEYERQKSLQAKGIAATSALDAASHNLHTAEQKKAMAEQAVNAALAALGGDPDLPIDQHPTILAALAARDKAAYDLEQTSVHAPADGIVYQASSFKPGQYVTVGSALFVLVETDDTWVEANFKETQLTHLRDGQHATVSFDAYPGRSFDAVVQAVGAGTGSEFSLLPAQNATGNWVKVTQRIPAYLRLTDVDPEMQSLLRTGMSATVTVDTGHVRNLATHLPAAIRGAS